MKKTGLITILAMIGLLLVACQSADEQPAATATQPAAVQLPVTAPPTTVQVNVDPNRLRQQPWQWISFQGAAEAFEIQSPQDYRLTFNQNGTVSVIADCNNASGGYGADNLGRMVIEMGAATQAVCPPGSRGEQFVNLLGSAARYRFAGSNLEIELMADGGTMTFAVAQPIAVQPTLAPATLTPVPPPPTPVPPTATPPSATNLPSPPGSVADRGPRQHATGSFQPPYYTVAPGDTIFGISQRFGVPVAQLLASNELDANGLIIPNQRLVIGAVAADGGATQLPSLPGSVVDQGPRQYATGTYQAPYYTVAGGDTLYSIAARFGLSLPQLMAANALDDTGDIFPGQKLIVSTTATGSAGYERVVFDNDIAATLNGVIDQGQPKHYVLGARAGQTMEINTTSAGVPLGVTVQAPGGQILALNGQNQLVNNALYVALPENGDYIVTVTPATLPEGPQMSFTITFVIQ